MDTVTILRSDLDKAIEAFESSLAEAGGCDHEINFCICADEAALHRLKLARGDKNAIAEQSRLSRV